MKPRRRKPDKKPSVTPASARQMPWKLMAGSALAAATLAAVIVSRGFAAPPPPQVAADPKNPRQFQALEAAREEVRRSPRSAATWAGYARALSAAGYSQQAAICLSEAARLDPRDPRWPYLQAIELAKQGLTRDSIPLLYTARAAARTREEQLTIVFSLGRTLIEEGKLAEAQETLAVLDALEPDGPRSSYLSGLLANARAERPLAIASLSRLTSHPSARRTAHQLLANLTTGDTARSHRNDAGRLPPDEPWPDPIVAAFQPQTTESATALGRYQQLAAAGRQLEALELLKQSFAQSPQDGPVAFALGVALLDSLQYDEAVRALQAAARLEPGQARTQVLLGGALVDHGERVARQAGTTGAAAGLFKEAIGAADRALALQGDSADAYSIRGRAQLNLGRAEEGIRSLRQAVLLAPQSVAAHLDLGDALARSGQLSEGMSHFEDARRVAGSEDPRPRLALERWQPRAKSP